MFKQNLGFGGCFDIYVCATTLSVHEETIFSNERSNTLVLCGENGNYVTFYSILRLDAAMTTSRSWRCLTTLLSPLGGHPTVVT